MVLPLHLQQRPALAKPTRVATSMGLALSFFVRSAASSEAITDDCLFANPVDPHIAESCSMDPLQLGSSVALTKAMKGMDVDTTEVYFVGCRHGAFTTSILPLAHTKLKYRIVYRIIAGADPSVYIAPLTHEIAHVLQLRQAGDLPRLRATMSSERIELGADFLAGYAFRKYMNGVSRNEFQHNLTLVGTYRAGTGYGSPEDRLQAFRIGYFSKLTVAASVAEDDFQRNGMQIIIASRKGFGGDVPSNAGEPQ